VVPAIGAPEKKALPTPFPTPAPGTTPNPEQPAGKCPKYYGKPSTNAKFFNPTEYKIKRNKEDERKIQFCYPILDSGGPDAAYQLMCPKASCLNSASKPCEHTKHINNEEVKRIIYTGKCRDTVELPSSSPSSPVGGATSSGGSTARTVSACSIEETPVDPVTGGGEISNFPN